MFLNVVVAFETAGFSLPTLPDGILCIFKIAEHLKRFYLFAKMSCFLHFGSKLWR
jgi:hypothetical protein